MGKLRRAAVAWLERYEPNPFIPEVRRELTRAFRAGAKWRSEHPTWPAWGELSVAAKEHFRTKVNQQPHERQVIIESNDLAQIMTATIGGPNGKYLPWDVRYGLAEAVQSNGYHRAAIPIDPTHIKMLREKLCVAQHAVGEGVPWGSGVHSSASVSAALQGLIDGLDALRPLGPDGKHGARHTLTCGCEGVNDGR